MNSNYGGTIRDEH